jgi:putative ABC transport system permease protein
MSLARDILQAGRTLRKSPTTFGVVVATVGLGICAVATVFSIVDALLLKPLPGVARQSELVNVHATAPDGSSFHSVSLATWRDLRAGNPALSDLAGFSSRLVSLSTGGEPSLAVAQIVTANFFSVLGAKPALGRFFLPREDEAPGRDAVVVISHRLWTSRFAGNPEVLGRNLLINGRPFTVVGVTQSGFVGTFLAEPFDLWIPTMMAPAVGIPQDRLTDRRTTWLELVGRLEPGATIESARRAMNVRALQLGLAYPDIYFKGVGLDVRPATGFEDSLRSAAVAFFAVLMGLAVLVLAIAGVNISGLLLARAIGRERELSVRLALGAGRIALLRQLLAESLLLFLAGGCAGIALTLATTSLLERFQLPTPAPLAFDLQPGPRVFAFAIGVSLLAGLVFGFAAALPASRPSALGLLRTAGATERRGTARLRSIFVAGQVAMSALLMVAAGLLFRTVLQAAHADPGFDPDGLTMTTLDLRMLGYDETRAGTAFEAIVARAAALPGVVSATTTGLLPLGPGSRTDSVSLPGAPPGAPPVQVDFCEVGDAYFATMKLRLLSGRPFGQMDVAGAPAVAIVNETLARRLWPGRDPLGRTLLRGNTALTVVGVARDAKYRRLWEDPRPFLYISDRQFGSLRRDLVIRSRRTGEAAAAELRSAIRAVEPNLPLAEIQSVRRYIGFSLLPQRVGSAVAGALGALGLLLAAVGLGAQVAFSVRRRTREIGIRMALGARSADVVRLETARGARTAAVGLALGLAGALLASRFLSSLLFGVRPADPLTFCAVAVLLGSTTLLVSFLPARRAARVDPMTALRAE